jgi:hypothetical protein
VAALDAFSLLPGQFVGHLQQRFAAWALYLNWHRYTETESTPALNSTNP